MKRDCITIYGSQRLIELLSKINHRISNTIIEQFRYYNSYPISYLDIGESNDTISFIYSNKVKELQREYDYKYSQKAWKEKRSEMKVGKVIKLLFGDSFPVNNPKGSPIPCPPIDIETFVNMFKAEREKNENYDRFEIVSGKDIAFWYNFKNYTRFTHGDTPLGKSCLRYDESTKFLDLYVKNPDKISMLILKDDQNKLRARSILWKLDNPESRIYMDRIYSVNDFDVEIFKDYARKNGWLHKERQTYGWNNVIVDTRNDSLYTPSNFIMDVYLNNKKFRYYPYLDTLSVYNTETGRLCNDGRLLKTSPHIHLIDPQGSYIDEVDHRPRVYSRYYDDDILRDESVYCQIDDDWVYESDSVYVHNTDGLRAIKGSNKIVKSEIIGKRKYFLSDRCVYSDYLNTYIFEDSVREAFIDDKKTQRVIIHFKMIGRGFKLDDNGDIIVDNSPPKKVVKKKDKIEDYLKFHHSYYDSDHIISINQSSSENRRIHPTERYSTEEEGDGSHMDLPRRIRRSSDTRFPSSRRLMGDQEEQILQGRPLSENMENIEINDRSEREQNVDENTWQTLLGNYMVCNTNRWINSDMYIYGTDISENENESE